MPGELLVGCVVGGYADNGIGRIVKIYGTVFNIGGGFCMTAGHVLEDAKENQLYGIGFGHIIGEPLKVCQLTEWNENLRNFDIGIIKAPKEFDVLKPLPWSILPREKLEDVWTGGYPFALNRELNTVEVRMYKGYIVSILPRFRSPTFKGEPAVYELSFIAPRGLSGAPVCRLGTEQVCGVVIGNRAIEMTVFRDQETTEAGSKTETYVRVEGVQYGIAITADFLARLRSDLLGKTIGEHLEEQGLIVELGGKASG